MNHVDPADSAGPGHPVGPGRRSFLAGAFAVGTGALLGSALTAGVARAAAGPVIADTGAWGARPASSPLNFVAGAPDKR
ncbi:hypothetical protein [Kitasatospora aureofaciens]|uniref:hypothetical protein n=1 Tax=Kitasatospora aureofaciens TaxID=1894 RepID=UPI0037C8ABC4